MDLPIYIIIGHGEEEEITFGEREKVEEGVKIVTLVESGTTSSMPEVCRTLQLFSNEANRELLSHPKENREHLSSKIGRPIRVYEKDQLFPPLQTIPLAVWNTGKIVKAVRSGIHTFPFEYATVSKSYDEVFLANIRKRNKGYNIEDAMCYPYLRYYSHPLNSESIHDIFFNSLYPTPDEVRGLTQLQIAYKYKKPLSQIIKDLGKGVYYFIACRATKTASIDSLFVTYLGLNIGSDSSNDIIVPAEHEEEYNLLYGKILEYLRETDDWLERAKRFLNMFEQLPLPLLKGIFEAVDGDLDYKKEDFQTKFKTVRDFIEKTGLTRAQSTNQQTAGKRKTRRNRRKL